MTAEWFDLGARLRAAQRGQAQPMLLHAPVVATADVVAVATRVAGGRVLVSAARPGGVLEHASGLDGLALLADMGVSLLAGQPVTLVAERDTLDTLWRLARRAPAEFDSVGGHVAWWRDRADFPGGRAVVDPVAVCRTRWVLGEAPSAEGSLALWRRWLHIGEDSVAGLLDLHALLTDGPPLRWLDVLAEDDVYAYRAGQGAAADGLDWRCPDSTGRAAVGLRSRCDAADLYAAALLTDPLYRRRAVHTGHVVTGVAGAPLPGRSRKYPVTCDRLDGRMRVGADVTGWTGHPQTTTAQTFSGSVCDAQVEAGQLVLTVAGVTGAAPALGDPVTLMPAAPSPSRQRSSRSSYRALYSARRSWLTTGKTPTVVRRPVPLEVLVAAAEPD